MVDNLLLAQYLRAPSLMGAQRASVRIWGSPMSRRLPHARSVGQTQRAAVARAIVNKPRLILADEPISDLDDANATAAVELLLPRPAHATQLW